MKRRTPLLTAGALIIYAFLYAPIVVIVAYSFNAAKRGGPWTGFTTHWYGDLVRSTEKLSAFENTAVLAVVSTLVATALGTGLGYGLSRYRFPVRKAVNWIIYLPVVMPDIVMAVALLMLFTWARAWLGSVRLGLGTMILSHITFQIPFVAIVVRARMTGMDPALEEAARDLGANGWQAFRRVTWPLMLPGVLAGAALAFTLSIDDFVISFFTSGPGSTTLPILIYASVKRGITPDVNALSTVIVLLSVLGTLAIAWLQQRGSTIQS